MVRQTGASDVFTGGSVEPWARRVDRAISEALREQAPIAPDAHDHAVSSGFGSDENRRRLQRLYAVRQCLSGTRRAERAAATAGVDSQCRFAGLGEPRRLGFAAGLPGLGVGSARDLDPGGGWGAERVEAFVGGGWEGYDVGRDFPARDGTSMLSPHLHFGEISAVQVWHQVQRHATGQARDAFIRELLWREFCAHLLWQNPRLPDVPLRPEFAAMRWRDDPAGLLAWQRGRPACRSSMPGCDSSGGPAGCTTGYA